MEVDGQPNQGEGAQAGQHRGEPARPHGGGISGPSCCHHLRVVGCHSHSGLLCRCTYAQKMLRQPQGNKRGGGLPRINQQPRNGVEVVPQCLDGHSRSGAGTGGLVGIGNVQRPLCGQILQGTPHGRGQFGKLCCNGVALASDCPHHRFTAQQPRLCHLAQLASGDAQAIGQRPRKAWALLHHAVELVTTQNAALQPLHQLRDGCTGRLSPGPA